MIAKVISGGQTGVDRAALDVALELGIPCGGYCPLGRLAEDGRIPDRYPLTETDDTNYAYRTACNVDAADATLILIDAPPLTGGTKLTRIIAMRNGKAHLIEYLNFPGQPITPSVIQAVRHWLHGMHCGQAINVAGPRESKAPGIHARAVAFLRLVLAPEKGRQP